MKIYIGWTKWCDKNLLLVHWGHDYLHFSNKWLLLNSTIPTLKQGDTKHSRETDLSDLEGQVQDVDDDNALSSSSWRRCGIHG